MLKRKYDFINIIGTISFIGIALLLILILTNYTNENNLAVSQYYDESKYQQENNVSPNSTIKKNEDNFNLSEGLNGYDSKDSDLIATISRYNQKKFGRNIIDGQAEIVSAIHQNNLNEEELGYLFLPKFPAQMNYSDDVKQMNIPLYLQKDAQWRDLKYGSSTTDQIGENGCAILSLAMVKGFLDHQEMAPQDILNWSKEKYWVHNEGTSWQIFYDFALENNYQFMNHGADFHGAMQAVQDGKPIIASVEPGYFTEVGHIIVIRGYEDGKVYINDPNDDPEKMFSLQGIDEEVLLKEGKNYWSFSN